MDYNLEFFILDKSGKYSKEEYLKKHLPDLYNKIISYKTDINPLSFKDKLYLFATKNRIVPRCLTCGKQLTIKNTLKKGFSKYCSVNCMNNNKDRKDKIKNNFFEKYGIKSHNQLEKVKIRKKETSLKNYGVDNPMHITSVKRDRNKKINDLTEGNIKRMVSKIPNGFDIISYNSSNIKLNCLTCGNDFVINSNLLNARIRLNKTLCTICNNVKTNTEISKLIKEILIEFNINFLENDRTIIKPLELDFYLPDYNFAIEVNGLYWHSEKYKDNNYHLNKTEECNKKSIQLLHIFEDEIFHKLHIVKSIIKNKLSLNKNKIYARKTIIKEVNNKTYREFLENNHIQGHVGAKIKLGLYYNNELVSIMSFGKPRNSMGNKKFIENSYELLRFCNKLDTNVIGGASKLFKYFIKTYNPDDVISYADRRWSDGGLYKNLGMEYKGKTKPNYYYINQISIKREYRFKYRKDVLLKEGYDKNKTEREIMAERGYLRIYDCGCYKYSNNFASKSAPIASL
ncbi:MAG: hypothetical protein ACOCVF_01735 [bacterium]